MKWISHLCCMALCGIIGNGLVQAQHSPGQTYGVASTMIIIRVADNEAISMTGSVENLALEESGEYGHLFPAGMYASAGPGRITEPSGEGTLLELAFSNNGAAAQISFTLEIPEVLTRDDGSTIACRAPANSIYWNEAGRYFSLTSPITLQLDRDETVTLSVGLLTSIPTTSVGNGGYSGAVRATVNVTGM